MWNPSTLDPTTDVETLYVKLTYSGDSYGLKASFTPFVDRVKFAPALRAPLNEEIEERVGYISSDAESEESEYEAQYSNSTPVSPRGLTVDKRAMENATLERSLSAQWF